MKLIFNVSCYTLLYTASVDFATIFPSTHTYHIDNVRVDVPCLLVFSPPPEQPVRLAFLSTLSSGYTWWLASLPHLDQFWGYRGGRWRMMQCGPAIWLGGVQRSNRWIQPAYNIIHAATLKSNAKNLKKYKENAGREEKREERERTAIFAGQIIFLPVFTLLCSNSAFFTIQENTIFETLFWILQKIFWNLCNEDRKKSQWRVNNHSTPENMVPIF